MNVGARVGSSFGLPKLGDLIELANAGIFVDPAERRACNDQNRPPCAAPPKCCVGRVAQLRVVDVVRIIATNVLLRYEICGAQWIDMVAVRCREELSTIHSDRT